MVKKVLTAAVTAALFGIASVSWAQGAGGGAGGAAGGGAAGGGAAASGGGSASGGAGGGGASPSSSSNTPGGGSATTGSTTSTTPAQCVGMTGMERDRCLAQNRGAASGASADKTPTHPGDAAKGDNRYNSPATGTGAHSVPGSGSGTGTRQ